MIQLILAVVVGFILGNLSGIILMALMVASSNDSRMREKMEEEK
jgi:ascorbate-specific PTS system EIIC-type component UlaA